MSQADHLLPMRRRLLELNDDLRIEEIHKDKIFISYPAADKILDIVSNMLNVSDRVQAPCLLVKGAGGSGKTSIINQIKHNKEASGRLVFLALNANPYNLKFGELLSDALGVPSGHSTNARYRKELLPTELGEIIKLRQIKGMVIDELQDAMLVARPEQLKNLSIIKGLTNAPYCLSLIGFGTSAAKSALTVDAQLSRRFHVVELEDWSETENFRSFLAGIEQNLPLKNASNLDGYEITKLLLELTGGRMDEVIKIIKSAASYAVKSGEERVTPSNLEKGLVAPWSY